MAYISIKTGTVVLWTGAYNAIPAGYLICDGTAINRTTYSKLFAVMSTRYGTGDGSTTFNLPDMRNRFPEGAPNATSGGATGGTSSHFHCIKNVRTAYNTYCAYHASGGYRSACHPHDHCLSTFTCFCSTLPPHQEFVFMVKV